MSGTWEAIGPWPDAGELQLLRAALLDAPAALDAWTRFKAVHRDLGDLDYGSYRVLPQLYRNLRHLGVDDPRMAHLKGVYRHAWYANQRLLHDGAMAVRHLQAAGIDPVLLKGAALIALYHDDVAVRPMDDVDLFVAPEEAPRAVELLSAAGFQYREPRELTDLMRFRHAVALHGQDGRTIDLHWSALFPRSDDEHLRRDAVAARLGSTRTLAPSPTDQLLLACAHGLGWAPAPLRWITDALLILRAAGDEIEWGELARRSRARKVALAVADALSFLGHEFAVPLPPGLTAELYRGAGPADRLLHDLKVNRDPSSPIWKVARQAAYRWDATRLLATAPGIVHGHPGGTLQYLREEWGMASRGAAIATAVRKGASMLRGAGPV
jgi:hypothetical protein